MSNWIWKVMAAGSVVVPLLVAPDSYASRGVENLYVAPWGSDSWGGTMERPFATPARAQREVRERVAGMRSDIVVHLRSGTYRLAEPLRLTEADSGRNGHRVVYQAHGKEQVTISGGRQVTGWREKKGVWQADVGDLDTRQLYVNGVRATKAALGAGLPGKVTTTETGYVTDSTVPQSWRNPEDIEFSYTFPFWVDARCRVAGITGNARQTRITVDEICWRLARDLYGDGEPLIGPTDVTNSPSFLRKPGSWYLDRERRVLSYLPRPGEDMRRAEVVAPVLETLVSGTGVHDVTFRGLNFAHATWLAPNEPAGFVSAWSMYKRPGVATWLTVPGNVVFHGSNRVRLEGNRFSKLGAQALEVSASSSDNVVEGNVFTDVSDGGILMGVVLPDTDGTNRGNRISDNWIHHVGVEYRGASAIWNISTQDTVIAHNQVNDVPYSGIMSGPDAELPSLARRNRIMNNRIFETNQVLADGGGIYLRGAQGTSYADGTVVQGNAVTEARRTGFDIGIYTDDTASWVTVRKNVVYNYVASIGGCSEQPERPVKNVRYHGNFWDDAVPDFLPRRDYPGAWPPASEDCGDPENLDFKRNTKLNPTSPDHACRGNPFCAAVLDNAGRTSGD